MSNFLYIIFVVIVNIIGWGMLVAFILFFFGYVWIMLTAKPSSGRNPHNPSGGSGMPWG